MRAKIKKKKKITQDIYILGIMINRENDALGCGVEGASAELAVV